MGSFERENIVKAVRAGLEPQPETRRDMGSYRTVSTFIGNPH